jgi:UDP-N-acetylglucosamine--N-acetylmuramyl-(pentapeptide) pyrophosphoryl-undecaprenol N-acetylglucosamine transferase
MVGSARPLVLLAAGGTGGHLFPAEALSVALADRGVRIHLATDARATRYGAQFPAEALHVIRSETVRSRNPFALAKTAAILVLGTAQAWLLLGRLRPVAVVGFGGYPTVPPVYAATLRRIPTIIHDANAVIGRANRLLSARVSAIATTFPAIVDGQPGLAAKAIHTGNPVRPAVVWAAVKPYVVPEPQGPLRLLVIGGSQGARVMADIVPEAIALLEPHVRRRLALVQQAREEDRARVSAAYERLAVTAEIAPFFPDLPARMAEAHLVISRSGASTVAELAAIGPPSILVPLPGALDQDQLANATVLQKAGGAILLTQDVFTADRLAQAIAALSVEPDRLAAMARAAKAAGSTDAAERLADLVMKVAGLVRME